ncbi:MAG: helix-turn-helix domain-containing protein [Bacteroidetes bacterium]|nr:helix-turn-helix domain-containing protein [Bacteroidota bacterium]
MMKAIRNKTDYYKALERMEELLKIVGNHTSSTDKNFIELDKLSNVIAEFEEKNYPMTPQNLIETIELRMFQRKLKQKDLAKLLGTSNARISEYMNGKRKLTLDIAKTLHKKLNIDAVLILNT